MMNRMLSPEVRDFLLLRQSRILRKDNTETQNFQLQSEFRVILVMDAQDRPISTLQIQSLFESGLKGW
jgi:hypothetical protein